MVAEFEQLKLSIAVLNVPTGLIRFYQCGHQVIHVLIGGCNQSLPKYTQGWHDSEG